MSQLPIAAASALPASPLALVERRCHPRARGGFRLVQPAGAVLVDLSPYGARLRWADPPEPVLVGSRVRLTLASLGRSVGGECVGLAAAEHAADGSVRVVFQGVDPALQAEIFRAAKSQRFCDGIREVATADARGGFRDLTARPEIDAALGRWAARKAILTFDVLAGARPLTARVVGFDPDSGRVDAEPRASDGMFTAALASGGRLAACTAIDHEAAVVALQVAEPPVGTRLSFHRPDRVRLTDRRAEPRKAVEADEAVVLELGGGRLRVVDRSAGGLGLLGSESTSLRVGEVVVGVLHEGSTTRSVGLLPKSVTCLPNGVRVGAALIDARLAAAPERGVVDVRWAASDLCVRRLDPGVSYPAERVTCGPAEGPVAALWNEVNVAPSSPKTVWVVPPAWGRTKESATLLSQVVCATAKASGEHAAVLRLDYCNTLGESFRPATGSDAGREAVGLTVSGCVADIRACVDYAVARLGGVPERLVLVGMSFSGPLCLRVAATDSRITHLVQLMGASDVQDLVRTATGGLDYVARHQAGLRSGLQNVLGLLSDTDRWVPDGLEHGLLHITHAQRDAGKLACELLWVQGDHDAFVNEARVRSTLAAASAPRRVLAQVACGHVPSRTDEAVLSIAPLLAFVGSSENGPPEDGFVLALPSDEDVARVTADEWAAAPRERLASPRDYWRRYMQGATQDDLGYDVLTLTREYGEMMRLQASMLAPRPGDTVHDIGGGLGHSVPHLVAEAGEITVHLYDLVPELLEAASSRWADDRLSLRTHVWDATEAVPESLAGASHVLMSLFLTVLPDPGDVLRRVAAVLPDGAVLVASSVMPDADLSLVYQRLLADIASGQVRPPTGYDVEALVDAVRAYICDAARLLRLAEEGHFQLFGPRELAELIGRSGFVVDTVAPCFGSPSRAVAVRAVRQR